MKAKYLVLAAIGAGIVLALRSEKGKAWSKDMIDDADKLKKKLNKLAGETGTQLGDLTTKLAKELSGLGTDARERVMAILNEGSDKAKSAKSKLTSEM